MAVICPENLASFYKAPASMLILLTIFILLFTPLAMLILRLVRPKFQFQGFLVILAVLGGWILVMLSRGYASLLIHLPSWEPASFFPTSPVLLVDDISKNFALAIMSLSLASISASIAQLGQSFRHDQNMRAQLHHSAGTQASAVEAGGAGEPALDEPTYAPSTWQSWAGMLILTGLGLLASISGNLLTLLLAWAGLDVMELFVLLGQVLESRSRERIILAFTARMAGIGTVLLAGIIPWSQGASLSFDAISQSTSIYLILAAGIRLGVLPLYLPYGHVLPVSRGLGTILRLVPAASSFILLVRVSFVGVVGPASNYLVGLTILAGLFASINWMNARDETNGRPYWLLGTASLAVISAIMNRPVACLAWSMTSILSGGLVFSMVVRHRNLLPLAFMGIFSLTALPFSPTWMSASLYEYSGPLVSWIPRGLFYLFALAILLTHAFLLVGFIRHALRGIIQNDAQRAEHIERWVWLLYPLGLGIIIATHFLIGWFLYPDTHEVTAFGWLAGISVVAISGLLWFVVRRYPHLLSYRLLSAKTSPLNRFISLEWIYPQFWKIYRFLTRLSSLFSTILEGDGGILWAMVLFALIFVFLQR
ncbi:MAG: hypothetical protein ACM3H7_04435 [Acidobacteriaceae bacterium]